MITELDDSNFMSEQNKRWKALETAKKKQEQSRQNSDQQSKWDARFESANKKIEALNSECKKSIKEVVLALASELKGLGFPVNRIANEIGHQSKGKWGSRSWILESLPDEYKDKSHQASAKRKHRVPPVQKYNSATTSDQIAPLAERQSGDSTTDLKVHPKQQVDTSVSVVDNSGNEMVEPAQTWQRDRSAESEPRSITTEAEQEETVNVSRPQPGPTIAIGGSVGQQHVCESCSTKDAKIKELEQAQNLNMINSGIGDHIEASSGHNRFNNNELSGEEVREGRRKCKNCEIIQQKCEELQSELEGYKEVVRIQTKTSIKTAKELYSTDGYHQIEFSVPFEPLHQHMIAAFNSNSSMNTVWFTGKFHTKTGEVVDVRIGRTTDTDPIDVSRMTS